MVPVPLRVSAQRHANLGYKRKRNMVAAAGCGVFVFIFFAWSLALQSPFSLPSVSSLLSSISIWRVTSDTTQGPNIAIYDGLDLATAKDLTTMFRRRTATIIASVGTVPEEDISHWQNTTNADGSWPADDIDYTAGCSARRANWPAQAHWHRIRNMSAVWHDEFYADTEPQAPLTAAILAAMNFWFDRDYTNDNCLDRGGRSECACDTPGLWNTNWYSNVILVPRLVIESCLLVQPMLESRHVVACQRFARRSYDRFYAKPKPGYLSGANTPDIAKIGIDLALLSANASLMAEAYGRVHDEVSFKTSSKVDGIKPDGSFSQHAGLLYNGGYGKDIINVVLELEHAAAGTQFTAGPTSRSAFEALVDGGLWMMFRNSVTGKLHWDFSALSRFISFPVADFQATSGLKFNLTQLSTLGELWNSETLRNAYDSLSRDDTGANAGDLKGNRYFWHNDYMVHRGRGYVSTFKMFSSRTLNTECINSQNPFGFHLSDGVLLSYLDGDEYEDIAASWDWDLLPLITNSYGATPLSCDTARRTGLHSFVGGVSTGSIGAAAMRYTNPATHELSWQKAVFFLDDDTQLVMVANVSSQTSSPVMTVLDQRRRSGSIFVNGEPLGMDTEYADRPLSEAHSLWHAGTGYLFNGTSASSMTMGMSTGPRIGNWSTIGISHQPPTTVDVFAAWVEHRVLSKPLSFVIFPGTTQHNFELKNAARSLEVVRNDASVSAVYDHDYRTLSVVFWDIDGGFVSMPNGVSVGSSANSAVILSLEFKRLWVSDPSQQMPRLTVVVQPGQDRAVETFQIEQPMGGDAGRTISRSWGAT
ncbi:polysaccharide lyase family 8 protein [Peniophora sp. CONT]|nr:polysaccharide lyase family 8 protein [Peniophora sp. CONT]